MEIMGLEGDYDPFADIPLNQIVENIWNYEINKILTRTEDLDYKFMFKSSL